MSINLRYPGNWRVDAALQRRLTLFVERAEEFRLEGTYRYPVTARIGIRAGGAAFSEAELPTALELRATAQLARHFYLKKEPLQLGRVCNLLYRAALDRSFREAIARIRDDHKRVLGMRLSWRSTEPELVTRRDLIDAFFNGHYFHSDPSRRALVQAHGASAWGPLVKQEFAQSLLDIYGSVRALLPIVENALGVDQLARCPTSQRVQRVLLERELGPTAISIAECRDALASEPGVSLRCELDMHLPDQQVEAVAAAILAVLQADHPGYREYALWWRGSGGLPRGVALPARGNNAEPRG